MSKPGLYLIAGLSLALALLFLTSAAPSKRLPAAAVASICLIVAGAALRHAARLPSRAAASERPLADVIPDPEVFLANLPHLVIRFHQWAAPRGAPLEGAPALLGWLRELEEDLQDPAIDLLLPAIAAYGELIRAELHGEWLPSRTLPGHELIVCRPRRPWTRRRVLYEVLDALSG